MVTYHISREDTKDPSNFSLWLRLPTHDADFELEKYKNQAGFSWTLMCDFQRLFVVVDLKNKQNGTTINAKYIAAVTACTAFSSKITLVMGSQPECRRQFVVLIGLVNGGGKSLVEGKLFGHVTCCRFCLKSCCWQMKIKFPNSKIKLFKFRVRVICHSYITFPFTVYIRNQEV